MKRCLFKSYLLMEADGLCYEPSEAEFHDVVSEILSAFQDCTLALPNLIPDPFFHSFTR